MMKNPKESLSYSCLLDPTIEDYVTKVREIEKLLAASVQVHHCKQHAYLYKRKLSNTPQSCTWCDENV